MLTRILPFLTTAVLLAPPASAQVWIAAGASNAKPFGFDRGVFVEAQAEGPAWRAEARIDTADKTVAGRGWSVVAGGVGHWQAVNAGLVLSQFGGPWSKTTAWWTAGIEADAVRIMWREEIWSTARNHQRVVDATVRFTRGRFLVGERLSVHHFYDAWPAGHARMGVAADAFAGIQLRGGR